MAESKIPKLPGNFFNITSECTINSPSDLNFRWATILKYPYYLLVTGRVDGIWTDNQKFITIPQKYKIAWGGRSLIYFLDNTEIAGHLECSGYDDADANKRNSLSLRRSPSAAGAKGFYFIIPIVY